MRSVQSLSSAECLHLLQAFHIQDPSAFWEKHHILPLNGFLLSLVESFTDLRQYFPSTVPDLMVRHFFVKVSSDFRSQGVPSSFLPKPSVELETQAELRLALPEPVQDEVNDINTDDDEVVVVKRSQARKRGRLEEDSPYPTIMGNTVATSTQQMANIPTSAVVVRAEKPATRRLLLTEEANDEMEVLTSRTLRDNARKQTPNKLFTEAVAQAHHRPVSPAVAERMPDTPSKKPRKPTASSKRKKQELNEADVDDNLSVVSTKSGYSAKFRHEHRSEKRFEKRATIVRYSQQNFLVELGTLFSEYSDVGKLELLRVTEMRLTRLQESFGQSLLLPNNGILEHFWQVVCAHANKDSAKNTVIAEQVELVMKIFYTSLAFVGNDVLEQLLNRMAAAGNPPVPLLAMLEFYQSQWIVIKAASWLLWHWNRLHPEQENGILCRESELISQCLLKKTSKQAKAEHAEGINIVLNCLAQLVEVSVHQLPVALVDGLLTWFQCNDGEELNRNGMKSTVEVCSGLLASCLRRDDLRARFEQQQGLSLFTTVFHIVPNNRELMRSFFVIVGKSAMKPCEQLVASSQDVLLDTCVRYLRGLDHASLTDNNTASLAWIQGVFQLLLLVLKQQPAASLDAVCAEFTLRVLYLHASASYREQQTLLLLGLKLLRSCITVNAVLRFVQSISSTLWQVFSHQFAQTVLRKKGSEDDETDQILLSVLKIWIKLVNAQHGQKVLLDTLVGSAQMDQLLLYLEELLQARDHSSSSSSNMKIEGTLRKEVLSLYMGLVKLYPAAESPPVLSVPSELPAAIHTIPFSSTSSQQLVSVVSAEHSKRRRADFPIRSPTPPRPTNKRLT